MDSQQLLERCEQEQARIEDIIWLAGAMAHVESLPERLSDDFMSDNENDDLIRMFDYIHPDIFEEIADGDFWPLAEWLFDRGKIGFCVKMATPEFKYSKSGKSARFSWGCHYYQWVYGETLEDAIEAGFQWVASRRKKEKASLKAA